MTNAKVYVRGMNLFSMDKLNGTDPEGIGMVYTTCRSYQIGSTVGF